MLPTLLNLAPSVGCLETIDGVRMKWHVWPAFSTHEGGERPSQKARRHLDLEKEMRRG